MIDALHQAGLEPTTCLLVLEPTGGYERAFWVALAAHGWTVRRVDAKQVRHFAKAHGLLAKTDSVDAVLLREYACVFPDRGSQLCSEKQHHIKALVARRSALVDTRKAVRCRLKQTPHNDLIGWDQELEETLTGQIRQMEANLEKLIGEEEGLATKQEHLRSIPGIGPVMAWMLISDMPELGKASDKQIAALAGVAPFAHESGKHQGKRFVQLGRKRLRNVLYQAAIVATQHNPDLKKFAQRLKQNGKPHKLIITAVARKLIVMANTIIRQNRKWVPV